MFFCYRHSSLKMFKYDFSELQFYNMRCLRHPVSSWLIVQSFSLEGATDQQPEWFLTGLHMVSVCLISPVMCYHFHLCSTPIGETGQTGYSPCFFLTWMQLLMHHLEQSLHLNVHNNYWKMKKVPTWLPMGKVVDICSPVLSKSPQKGHFSSWELKCMFWLLNY